MPRIFRYAQSNTLDNQTPLCLDHGLGVWRHTGVGPRPRWSEVGILSGRGKKIFSLPTTKTQPSCPEWSSSAARAWPWRGLACSQAEGFAVGIEGAASRRAVKRDWKRPRPGMASAAQDPIAVHTASDKMLSRRLIGGPDRQRALHHLGAGLQRTPRPRPRFPKKAAWAGYACPDGSFCAFNHPALVLYGFFSVGLGLVREPSTSDHLAWSYSFVWVATKRPLRILQSSRSMDRPRGRDSSSINTHVFFTKLRRRISATTPAQQFLSDSSHHPTSKPQL